MIKLNDYLKIIERRNEYNIQYLSTSHEVALPVLRKWNTWDGSRMSREVCNICLFLQIPDFNDTGR